MKLEDYFDAYDKTYGLTTESTSPEDWKDIQKSIHQALARPIMDLAFWTGLLILFLLLGIFHDPMYYLISLGTLFLIPQYIRDLRAEDGHITNLSNDEELWIHLQMEAAERKANVLGAVVLWGCLSLIFLLNAVNFWVRESDPNACVVASLVFGAIAAYMFFYRYPSECREYELISNLDFEEEDYDEEEEHDA